MGQAHDVVARHDHHQGFDRPEVVESYAAAAADVTAAEQHLFDRYLWPRMSLLDLGVGTGRTSPYLAGIAGRYLGADVSPGMVAVAANRFPDLEFAVADAGE